MGLIDKTELIGHYIINIIKGVINVGLGDELFKLRSRMGMSQEDLANKMNVSRQSISDWQNDKRIPNLENLVKLSKELSVSLEYLMKYIT